MARQIEGVYERVLECARTEFEKKGFSDASLREIAAEAGTSTGSIYTRFTDKAGLFRALVEPAAHELKELMLDVQQRFSSIEGEKQTENMEAYNFCMQMRMVDYIYDHFDAFYLLLQASHGTEYTFYIDELIDIEVEYTTRYLSKTQRRNALPDNISDDCIHIMSTAYYNAIFEVVRHKMSKEKATLFAKTISQYHTAGFREIFQIPKGSSEE